MRSCLKHKGRGACDAALLPPRPLPDRRASPHYSWRFVAKPPRRQARRARGVPRGRGVLETVRRGRGGRARPPAWRKSAWRLVAAAYRRLQ